MQVKIKLLRKNSRLLHRTIGVPVTNLAEEQHGGERERLQGEERGILRDGRRFGGGLIGGGRFGTRRLNRTN